MKSDKVMSLESVSVGAEDYKFEKERNLRVDLKRSEITISA